MSRAQRCTECQEKSLPGFFFGKGKCAYHWARLQWGKEWADRCYPDRAQKAGLDPAEVTRRYGPLWKDRTGE